MSYIRENIHRSDLFTWRFFHNAKRFGAIAKTADLGKVPLKKIAETLFAYAEIVENIRAISILGRLDHHKAEALANFNAQLEAVLQSYMDGLLYPRLVETMQKLRSESRENIQTSENEISYQSLDWRKIKKTLNWQPKHSIKNTINKVFRWYKKYA